MTEKAGIAAGVSEDSGTVTVPVDIARVNDGAFMWLGTYERLHIVCYSEIRDNSLHCRQIVL